MRGDRGDEREIWDGKWGGDDGGVYASSSSSFCSHLVAFSLRVLVMGVDCSLRVVRFVSHSRLGSGGFPFQSYIHTLAPWLRWGRGVLGIRFLVLGVGGIWEVITTFEGV